MSASHGDRRAVAGEDAARRRRPPVEAEDAEQLPKQDFNEQRLIFKGHLGSLIAQQGYRRRDPRGSRRRHGPHGGNTLVIENATSVLLLTRIEYFPDYSEEQGGGDCGRRWNSSRRIMPALLERARKVQSEMLNRVTVDFGGAANYGLSSEELLSAQRSSPGYSGAFLETLFEMCRYWFILTSGKYCSMSAETNANINLQIAPGRRAITAKAWRPTSTGWRASSRTSAPTPRTSSACAAPIMPSRRPKSGASKRMFDYAGSPATGETWPHAVLAFRRTAGACGRSGTTTSSPGNWISSASASCRPIKTWRCSTRIS